MPGGKQNKRQKRGHPANDRTPVAPIGSFYGASAVNRSSNDIHVDDESFYWQPGATLPLTSTPSRAAPLHSTALYPATHQPSPQSESESEEDTSLQSTLKAILSSQTAIQKQMEEVLCRVNNLEESVKDSALSSSASSSDERKRKKRLPSELCGKVATIYQALAVEDQFHLSERGDSVWNNKVKTKLREEVTLADKENGFSSADVDTAIKRYFESRKRLHRESKPEHRARVSFQEKQRKARSRRQRLFDRRKKCVRGSEQSWWDQLSLEYMSFESSDDEESVIRVHSLPWRSKKLNEFLSVLDKRADEMRKKLKHYAAERKPRQCGETAANSMPPENSPKWTVSIEIGKETMEKMMTVKVISQER